MTDMSAESDSQMRQIDRHVWHNIWWTSQTSQTVMTDSQMRQIDRHVWHNIWWTSQTSQTDMYDITYDGHVRRVYPLDETDRQTWWTRDVICQSFLSICFIWRCDSSNMSVICYVMSKWHRWLLRWLLQWWTK